VTYPLGRALDRVSRSLRTTCSAGVLLAAIMALCRAASSVSAALGAAGVPEEGVAMPLGDGVAAPPRVPPPLSRGDARFPGRGVPLPAAPLAPA
jgi:hypothetical protein